MKDIYMIGNTHFDPVWLWKWEEAMTSIHATFRSALDRMNEDPEFVYSFATPIVFEWIRNIDPDMLEEIKARVKEGRWELCEGWWLQPDCFSGSGESYARQGLYGQRYLIENFGVCSDTVFNVDSFGHSSATPQLLKKIRAQYYCMCRPEPKHYPFDAPFFRWEGNDGSAVNAFRIGQYSEIYNKDMEKNVAMAESNMQNAPCDELMVFGVTDHGGAPTKKAIADIHRLNAEKPYTLKCSTVTGYFEAQDEPSVTVKGEMITRDFGPYTNNHEVKRRNRVAEYAVLNAEKASVLAKHLLGRPYEKKILSDCWKDVLFNQFHDILGGACIKAAYVDTYNQQGRAAFTAEEITQYRLQAITKKIRTLGRNPENPWNIVVWNLNDADYEGYIESEIQWLHEFPAYSGELVLEDGDGVQYPCQIIRAKAVIPGFRSRFVFRARIPAMGYKSFKVIQTGGNAVIAQDTVPLQIETKQFSVRVNGETGKLESVQWKQTGKVYENLLTPACFEDDGDTWCFNTNYYGKKLEDWKLSALTVTESGCRRTTLKATYTFRGSLLHLWYTFYDDADFFDVRYSVNWNEKFMVLKLMSDTGSENVIVSSPFSTETRTEGEGDYPMGEWICAGDDDGRIAFLCDSLFSYSRKGSEIGLSILRSCIYGDLRMGEFEPDADHDILEQGITEGTVRVLMAQGSIGESGIAAQAAALNNPPIVLCDANHDGIYGWTDQFMKLCGDGVSLSALKEWEDGREDVLRVYEYAGKSVTASLTWLGKTYEIALAPYEIKTLKVTESGLEELYIIEDLPIA